VPHTRRESERNWVVERFGVADGLIHVRELEGPGEVEEAVGPGFRSCEALKVPGYGV
jgi:hypothetical protein